MPLAWISQPPAQGSVIAAAQIGKWQREGGREGAHTYKRDEGGRWLVLGFPWCSVSCCPAAWHIIIIIICFLAGVTRDLARHDTRHGCCLRWPGLFPCPCPPVNPSILLSNIFISLSLSQLEHGNKTKHILFSLSLSFKQNKKKQQKTIYYIAAANVQLCVGVINSAYTGPKEEEETINRHTKQRYHRHHPREDAELAWQKHVNSSCLQRHRLPEASA